MGFFIRNKEEQRKIERIILILYSLYDINFCIGVIRNGWAAWVMFYMLAALAVNGIVWLGRYKNFRTRAILTTFLTQLAIILYAIYKKDLGAMLPYFMVLAVLVAFYGIRELLWVPAAAIFFVIFHYGFITGIMDLTSAETLVVLLPQLGNILCLDFVLYVWVKKRNESNEQIYKMVEALMEAEQSKDDFLSNISHEIRTPVNTICGMSEMALREHDLEKMREEVFDIRDAGNNLMSLVSDILDFSQLQQGKMEIEEEAYSITSTINDIINMAMARKGDKQIELIVDCAADIPSELVGDEQKIRRVIMNLVDNAIKFTNEGGVIISIGVRRENYGVNLCISIKDTGIGISEENLEKLFESFSQVDTRRNRQRGGVGLGLAISRALIMKMGGTITVQSRLGRGSVFRFVVPQKVLNEEHIGRVIHREKVNAAAYFDMEQFEMMAIRDEYTKLIIHLATQLQVRCHACRNLAELKRRQEHEGFTHIFISLEEYQEDEAYFDDLAKHTNVIIVIERPNEKYISNPELLRLYKPFYILPVVCILNGSRGSAGGRQMVRPGKFTAPDVHVLAVDDNRMNIRVFEGLLNDYQIKVSYATSGQEALKMIENMSYDLVFMDHMMPEMDGVETMHRIRNKPGNYYKKVPIIALTANAAPGNREMFLEEGFDDFVAKPVEISVLERVLKRNLPEGKLIFPNCLLQLPETGTDMEAAAVVEDKAEKEGGDSFTAGDLDVRQGMLYCGGKEKYLAILEACCEEGDESRLLLEDLYEKRDWKNYIIKIHALKSTMRNIGANSLSEMAKALEKAGREENIGYILENHGDMLAEHHRVMEELKHALQPGEKRAAEGENGAADGQHAGQSTGRTDLPELTDNLFDRMLSELEEFMYAFDSGQMLAVLAKMQEYRYCGAALESRLAPVKKKIEMTDYMSAVDAVSRIREELRREGGAVQ